MNESNGESANDKRRLACSYARVSSPNDKREASLATQEKAIVDKLEAMGFRVPPEYRFREKFTGMESMYDRPVLNRIRDLSRDGVVKAVGCYDTDRLGRDPGELATLVKGFKKDNTLPVFVQMDQLPPGRTGEMLLFMKGISSAMEWDLILDRTARGRGEVYDAGRWLGPGRVRYGLAWDRKTRTRSADPDRAPIVRRIFGEAAMSVSPREIAARLDAEGVPPPFRKGWVAPTIRGIIRNPTYKGLVVGRLTRSTGIRRADGTYRQESRPEHERPILTDARTEALVDEELWDRANAAIDARRHNPSPAGRNKHQFLLAGRIWCALEGCGHRMSPVVDPRRNRPSPTRCYVCSGSQRSLARPSGCRSKLGAARLEEQAIAKLGDRIMRSGWFEGECERIRREVDTGHVRSDLAAADGRLAKIAREKRALVDLLAGGECATLDAPLREKLAALAREESAMESQRSRSRSALADLLQADRIIDALISELGPIRRQIAAGEMTRENWRDLFIAFNVEVMAQAHEPPKLRIALQSSGWGNVEGITKNRSAAFPSVLGTILVA